MCAKIRDYEKTFMDLGYRLMPTLTSKQLKQYKDLGYVAPIDILSLEEVKKIRTELEYIEKKWPDELIGLGRNNVHFIFFLY